jgi:hypothetical protein
VVAGILPSTVAQRLTVLTSFACGLDLGKDFVLAGPGDSMVGISLVTFGVFVLVYAREAVTVVRCPESGARDLLYCSRAVLHPGPPDWQRPPAFLIPLGTGYWLENPSPGSGPAQSEGAPASMA